MYDEEKRFVCLELSAQIACEGEDPRVTIDRAEKFDAYLSGPQDKTFPENEQAFDEDMPDEVRHIQSVLEKHFGKGVFKFQKVKM